MDPPTSAIKFTITERHAKTQLKSILPSTKPLPTKNRNPDKYLEEGDVKG
jgi:hypothetical protein